MPPDYPCPPCHGSGVKRRFFIDWKCRYCRGVGAVSIYESLEWHRKRVLNDLRNLENAKLPRWITGDRP